MLRQTPYVRTCTHAQKRVVIFSKSVRWQRLTRWFDDDLFINDLFYFLIRESRQFTARLIFFFFGFFCFKSPSLTPHNGFSSDDDLYEEITPLWNGRKANKNKNTPKSTHNLTLLITIIIIITMSPISPLSIYVQGEVNLQFYRPIVDKNISNSECRIVVRYNRFFLSAFPNFSYSRNHCGTPIIFLYF